MNPTMMKMIISYAENIAYFSDRPVEVLTSNKKVLVRTIR